MPRRRPRPSPPTTTQPGTIYHPRPYCFVFEGEVYCITLPQTHRPLPE